MLLAVVFLSFFLFLGWSVYSGILLLYPLLWGLCGVGFVASRRGYSLGEIFCMGYAGARKSLIVVEVFFHIGALTAAWRAAGTIGFLVYYGFQLLSPDAFIVGCFALCAVFSVLLGTAIGTVGVLGISLVVMAKGGGLNPALAAGAIIAGAYFGDRCSPMSSSAHLVASLTRTDVYANLKNMFRSALLPLILSLTGYALLSKIFPLASFENRFTEDIAELFQLHPLTVVPAVLVLVGCMLRIRIKNIMFCSTLTAMVIAVTLQEVPFTKLFRFLVTGYVSPIDSPAAILFNGGGWISIINSILIVFFSSAFAGVFEGAQLLAEVERRVQLLFQRIGGYLTNLIVSILVSAAACNQTLAILLVAQIQSRLYPDVSEKARFALMLENSVILISPLIPWNIALSLPMAVLDVGPDCIPFLLFLWFMPLTGWFWPRSWNLAHAYHGQDLEKKTG